MATKKAPPATVSSRRPVNAKKAALLEEFADYAGIKVIERRMDHPDLPGSVAIRLKDEPPHTDDPQNERRKWYVRWIDTGQDGRYATITSEQGYVPVRIAELQHADHVTGLVDNGDGVVRRGDKGRELLVKMPLKLYRYIKAEQQGRRERRERNARLVKQDLADSAGRSLGDEAGQTIHDEFTVDIRRRKTTLGDEMGELAEVDQA
jgi:hypothetical protein